LPAAKVAYEKPAAEDMSKVLAGKLGITEELFQRELLLERQMAEAAAAEARANAEKCRKLHERMKAGSVSLSITAIRQRQRAEERFDDDPREIHFSFAWEDVGHRHHYCQAVDRETEGWMTSALLDRAVADRYWFDKWMEQLNVASAVVVINTATYYRKLGGRKGYSLMVEREAIIQRRQADPTFKVFALDPEKPGHTGYDLKALLDKDELEVNFPSWKDAIQCPEPEDTGRPCAVGHGQPPRHGQSP